MDTIRVITLPNGRSVRLSVYTSAWKALRGLDPSALVQGFGHFELPAGLVLREMREGMHDRINRRLPGFGAGRKWSHDWQRAAYQTARSVNTPRLIVRWVPKDLLPRLAHRLTTEVC